MHDAGLKGVVFLNDRHDHPDVTIAFFATTGNPSFFFSFALLFFSCPPSSTTPPELPAPGPRHGPWRIPGRRQPTNKRLLALAMRSSAEEDRPVGPPSTSSSSSASVAVVAAATTPPKVDAKSQQPSFRREEGLPPLEVVAFVLRATPPSVSIHLGARYAPPSDSCRRSLSAMHIPRHLRPPSSIAP
jgi:hypothetical protein